MKNYAYKYFIFLDADTFFVRKPPPLLALVHDSPIHSFFEADCTRPLPEQTWHRCPLQTYVRLMHESGVASKKIYASNGGFFIVQREFIDTVCDLAADFWKHAFLSGYAFTEEPSLTYATHMLCKNPDAHLLQNYPEVWSNDWEGHFANNFPDGRPWTFTDYLSKKQYPVNPAIVHMMKGKKLLIDAGKKLALQKS